MDQTKMKTLLYTSVSVASLLIAGAVAYFGFRVGLFYTVAWALFAAAVCAVIARVVFHAIMKDADAECWRVSIYFVVAALAWLGCILTTSWNWLFGWSALLVGALFMAVGYRFIADIIDPAGVALPLLESLKQNCRYKFVGDDPNRGEDKARPLCAVNNEIMTVIEADAKGYGAIAANGIEYLKTIEKKIVAQEEK